MKDFFDLESIGFTAGEEKVYLALLQLGASSTGPIAKKADVSRSKLYEILEKLSRKGVVSHYKRNGISQYKAAAPEKIVDYIERKEKVLQEQKEQFEKSLPLFDQFMKESLIKEAEVYEGMEGIRTVRDAALRNLYENDKMLFFGNDAVSHKHVLGYWDEWNRKRIKKKIWSYTIYNQDARYYGERRKKLKYTKVRYLPKKGPSHAWVEVYGEVVAIALKHKSPMSIVIRNPLVAESFRLYFSILWDVSKPLIPTNNST